MRTQQRNRKLQTYFFSTLLEQDHSSCARFVCHSRRESASAFAVACFSLGYTRSGIALALVLQPAHSLVHFVTDVDKHNDRFVELLAERIKPGVDPVDPAINASNVRLYVSAKGADVVFVDEDSDTDQNPGSMEGSLRSRCL